MSLSGWDRVRYARQLLLPQLGESGQERLMSVPRRLSSASDPSAREVAARYLRRAGVPVVEEPDAVEIPLAGSAQIDEMAGRPELREAARALAGALAAVDVMRAALSCPSPALSALPVICSEEP